MKKIYNIPQTIMVVAKNDPSRTKIVSDVVTVQTLMDANMKKRVISLEHPKPANGGAAAAFVVPVDEYIVYEQMWAQIDPDI